MSHANLTARYRPQTFAALAGQETVRAIISRAAAEDRVAPAYLFSGTRGVGKTTIARIFAKALNCERAPGPEPCNECERCRQITAGTAVDVVEIDGASNRGIDDVRRLKEVVGYAPMDGRYKVFIIDEAHMLSRDAFNALLKTLEEPPARVTFIMATTEAHKFPATILSRCQHFVFKRLPEAELEAHLASVMTKENAPYEDAAIRLIARRAAGSVRDAMSLLGQVLALGGETLTEDDTRRVLGLAGQELFFRLFDHLRDSDTLAITSLVREMLDSGLDLGFFLRELAASWRILFMLDQAGDAAIPLLDIPAADAARWRETAASFNATHVHAAWQMTLDGQRRVLTSLEPSLALELLLLNLALLPRLLSMEQLSSRIRKASPPHSGGQNGGQGDQTGGTAPGRVSSSLAASQSRTKRSMSSDAAMDIHIATPVERDGAVYPTPEQAVSASPTLPASPGAPLSGPAEADPPPELGVQAFSAQDTPVTGDMPDSAAAESRSAPPGTNKPFTWDAFVAYCAGREDITPGFMSVLRGQVAREAGETLEITPDTALSASQLEGRAKSGYLAGLLRGYCGREFSIRILSPAKPLRRMSEVKEALKTHPGVVLLEKHMGAKVIDYGTTKL